MPRTPVIALLLYLAAGCPAHGEAPPETPVEESTGTPVGPEAEADVPFEEQERRLFEVTVDRILREQMESWRVPGAAVALVEEGSVLVLAGYGVADVATGRPVDPQETAFHVASLAKPVTASAVLQLVDRALLDLDGDVNRYLRSLSVPEAFPEPVTMRHLLTHTAGFDERIIGRKVRPGEEPPPLGEYLRTRLPPRIRPPGKVSIYSDHGYALAGLVAAEIVDTSFERFVDAALFEPLEMERSSFGPSPRTTPGLATGYGWAGLDGPAVPPDRLKTVPASMLLTTAADMSRWMLAMLEGGSLQGRRVLEPATAGALTSRQFSNHVSIPGRSLGFSEDARFDPPAWLHAGGTAGFTSALVLLPDRRAGLFLVFNSQAYIWETVDRILERYKPVVGERLSAEITGIDTDLERFTGHYREAGISATTIEKLATLIDQERVTVAGRRDLLWRGRTYRAVGRLVFQAVDGGARLGFVESGADVSYLAFPGIVREKVPRWEARPVQVGLWSFFTLVFLITATGWVGVRLPAGSRSAQLVPAVRPRLWPLRLASWTSILNLVFLVTLGVVLARALDGGELQYGAPDNLRFVLALPFAGSVLSLVVALAAVGGWARGSWSLATRLKLSLVALTLLAFAFHLHYWNLLGFRF